MEDDKRSKNWRDLLDDERDYFINDICEKCLERFYGIQCNKCNKHVPTVSVDQAINFYNFMNGNKI